MGYVLVTCLNVVVLAFGEYVDCVDCWCVWVCDLCLFELVCCFEFMLLVFIWFVVVAGGLLCFAGCLAAYVIAGLGLYFGD